MAYKMLEELVNMVTDQEEALIVYEWVEDAYEKRLIKAGDAYHLQMERLAEWGLYTPDPDDIPF